jgi:hypothetical protein
MLNKPKHNIFMDSVLRRDSKGTLYLMNHPEKGWSSSAIIIESEEYFLANYNVKLGEWAQDQFSECCPVFKADSQ